MHCDPHTANLCDLALGEAPWDRRGQREGIRVLEEKIRDGHVTSHAEWRRAAK